jgi:capsular polysaccharide biosynthesis protein
MITTDRLADIAERVWEYGRQDAVEIKKPVGVQELPQEWKEKLVPYQFNKAKAYLINSVNLCGPGLVGIWHNDIVLDTAYFGRIDLWERNKPYFHWARKAMDMPVRRVEYATSFVNVWSHNYFHWVLDLMPRLEFLMKMAAPPLVIVQQNPPEFTTWTLDKLGLKWEEQQADHYFVERCLVFSNRREAGRIPPGAIRFLQGLWNEDVYTSEKIYTSRNDAHSRQVVNEEEVVDLIGGLGFHPVQAGKYSFEAQIKMFGNASWIIGPHGSALANMVWAENPKVIELVSSEYTNPCCWMIAACMGWDYGYVIGEPSDKGHEFIEVDVKKLDQVIGKMR